MIEEKFIQLVTRYLSKEASCSEIEQLNSLLKQKKYSTHFTSIKERWNEAGDAESLAEFKFENGVKLLTAKIRNHNPSFQWSKETKQNSYFSYQSPYLRIAASIAFLMILATATFFIVDVLKQRSGAITLNEKKTVMGEKVIVTLLDGTKITLNADSKLRYPVRFGEESREVILKGEAYFEVAQNADKPFIVRTGKISTTDLGTKFDVKAFPDDKSIIVSLEDGKVKVSADGSGNVEKEKLLMPTQQLVYNKEDETSKIESFDFQKTIGWKDNILVFDNEPLSDVLVPLERYFGVKFEIADPSLAGRTIKANFRNESFWTVIKVIEKATGLRYTAIKENNELRKIVFFEN